MKGRLARVETQDLASLRRHIPYFFSTPVASCPSSSNCLLSVVNLARSAFNSADS
jgi:hypothetical protein